MRQTAKGSYDEVGRGKRRQGRK